MASPLVGCSHMGPPQETPFFAPRRVCPWGSPWWFSPRRATLGPQRPWPLVDPKTPVGVFWRGFGPPVLRSASNALGGSSPVLASPGNVSNSSPWWGNRFFFSPDEHARCAQPPLSVRGSQKLRGVLEDPLVEPPTGFPQVELVAEWRPLVCCQPRFWG